jgi:aminodeoxyfutalosine deaminase
MILRARTIVTMDGPPIDDGAVRVDRDRIVEVGKFSEVFRKSAPDVAEKDEPAESTEEIIDLGERALLPGLINAHCHLDYTCLRGKIPPPESFADWIRAINAAKGRLNPSDYQKSIAAGFAEAQKFGTTSIVNYEAFPELIFRMKPPIRTWWLAELIDVRDPNRPEEIVASAMTFLSKPKNRGLAPHALYTASFDLYRVCQENARRHDWLLSTHLAESREEIAMFSEGSGPLYGLMEEIGRNMRDCGGQTPIAAMLSQIALDQRWLVVHLNEISEGDFDLLLDTTMEFHVVHCPRSHQYFRHSRFQLEQLREFNFNVCLGTDSLASNDDLSLFAEMRAFQKNFPDVSPEEILAMVTLNPARALGKRNELGRIRANCLADLIAVPINPANEDVFEEIIAFDGAVPFSMVDGVIDARPS